MNRDDGGVRDDEYWIAVAKKTRTSVPLSPEPISLLARRMEATRPEAPGSTLEEVLGAHLASLYRTARVLTGNAHAAEDLVQESVVKACRAWDQLRSVHSAKAWLLQIVHRTFLNTRRGEARRVPLVDLDVHDEELLADALLAQEPLASAELSEAVAAALDALPVGFREALWLLDVEELKISEAAEVLDLPPGTVASRAHRGRQKLRALLEGAQKGGG